MNPNISLIGHYLFLISLIIAGTFCVHYEHNFAALCIFLMVIVARPITVKNPNNAE